MANGDEYEKFEITEHDLQNEFNTGFRRKGLSKEQQIYGIWAENDDDDESSSKREERNFSYGSKNILQKGLNFVAGGIQQAGKEKKVEEDEEDEDDLKNFYPKPMFGTQLDSSEDEDNEPLEMIRNSELKFGKGKQNNLRNLVLEREGGIGEWEKHTTGIGSKLMKMMGYEEGKGLGKNLQGIATPVEAQKRKGKGAIGFYGNEKVERKNLDSTKSESGAETGRVRRWRKTSAKKPKFVYKTTEEVISEGKVKPKTNKSDSHITGTKVIDMTGPETRVLSSYQAIGAQKPTQFEEIKVSKKYEYFDIPELIHNLDLLLEKTEESIVRNAKTSDFEENRIVHLNHEREKYETILEREEKVVRSLESALDLIELLKSKHNDSLLTLDEASRIFTELKRDYWEVFNNYELRYLCTAYVLPLLKQIFVTWNPIVEPNSHIEILKEWQSLVEKEESYCIEFQSPDDKSMDPYHRIVWDTWSQSIRCCVMGLWDPRDCTSLINVFEAWKPPLIPYWIYSNILRLVVLPRITRAVNEWNPMQDTVPIHTWIHPWLPLIADDLQAVYPVIRQKLSSALVHWHPSDRSAKMVLQPWKGVFSELSMVSLIQASIQPKLEVVLLEMNVDPCNQNIEAWKWFTDWQDFLPVSSIESILSRCFFPKWYQALGSWLSLNPPYCDAIAWYKFWKDMMPSKVGTSMQVQQKFQRGLEICQRALSHQAGAKDQFSFILGGFHDTGKSNSSDKSHSQNSKDWSDVINSGSRKDMSMRELVERKCQQKGIMFYPVTDRLHDGRRVYKCGTNNISFDKNIIYMQGESGWAPRSLTRLFDNT